MKTLHLVYGDNPEAMQKVAGELRGKNPGAEIGLRSASAFVNKPEIETAGSVHVVGDYPVIKDAYDGLTEVKTHAAGKAEQKEETFDPTFGQGTGDLTRQKLDAARRFDQARAEGRLAGKPEAEETVKSDQADERAKVEKMKAPALKKYLKEKGITFSETDTEEKLKELALAPQA